MNYDIIVAGFGGQGVMIIGKMIAFAAMKEGKNVSWFPSYGPEMRGGTANCTVVISDEEVGSPIVTHPDMVVAMNLPSFDRFEKDVKPGGVMVYNSSMGNFKPRRTDIEYIGMAANDLANELGNPRVGNIIILGAVSKKLPLKEESYRLAMEDALHRPELMPLNLKAFDLGRHGK
jgi:2-oxoglutarate ferredoxin oxidoreductase subunit gamma